MTIYDQIQGINAFTINPAHPIPMTISKLWHCNSRMLFAMGKKGQKLPQIFDIMSKKFKRKAAQKHKNSLKVVKHENRPEHELKHLHHAPIQTIGPKPS